MKKSIFIVGLLVLVLGLYGCGDSGPYGKFSGTWERAGNGSVMRVTYDFEKKQITIFSASERDAEQYRITKLFGFTDEFKDNTVAIAIPGDSEGFDGTTTILEVGDNGAMTMKDYRSRIPLDAALTGKAPTPQDVMEFTRPQKKYDQLFSKVVPTYEKMDGEWYSLNSDSGKPALRFDAATGKLSLLDDSFRNHIKKDILTARRYSEELGRSAELYFEDLVRDMVSVSVYGRREYQEKHKITIQAFPKQSPMISLDIEGIWREQLLPKMSKSEKQKWIADQELQKQKAAEAERILQERVAAEAAEAERVRQEKIAEEKRIQEEKAAEEERLRAEEEAERQRLLAEKRAAMPEFTFGEFSLSDTPQQIINKALSQYNITTTFPVQQSGTTIQVIKRKAMPGKGFVEGGSLLKEFLSHTDDSGDRYYLASIPDFVRNSGLQIDGIYLDDKSEAKGSTRIYIYYYTLPGKSPVALYMNVAGAIVQNDVPVVYAERYGEPEEKGRYGDITWLSDRGIAVAKYDDLYIISKSAYDEVSTYVKKIEAAEAARREAEQKARRGKI